MQFKLRSSAPKKQLQILCAEKLKALEEHLSKKELKYLSTVWKEENIFSISIVNEQKVIVKLSGDFEQLRKVGADVIKKIKANANLVFVNVKKDRTIAFLEGIVLSDYNFDKYLTNKKASNYQINIIASKLSQEEINELKNLTDAVKSVRDLVNEPVNKLNTEEILSRISNFKSFGVEVEVYRKSKLESLNMGGILGVNQGSNEEPALVELSYAPKGKSSSKPVVLVGKGILFDTGGINIKTGDFMTNMKADMGGAATVLGIVEAVAKNKLPIHIKALLPITENRINGNELVPGDVIKMHNGKTVEVLNTDAEGRLVLADALSFAQRYNPKLVLDMATLTGSAYRLTAHNGAVVMGTANSHITKLTEIGDRIYERLIHLPMWPEFEKTLESNVADLNNLGSGEGQAICAGFFLKHFVDEMPWVHIDIAGPAFIPADVDYKKKGGTGFGVRLVYEFLKHTSLK